MAASPSTTIVRARSWGWGAASVHQRLHRADEGAGGPRSGNLRLARLVQEIDLFHTTADYSDEAISQAYGGRQGGECTVPTCCTMRGWSAAGER